MSTTTWVSPTRNQSGYQQVPYSTYCPSQTYPSSWYRPSEPVEYQPKPKINYTQDSNHNITHLGNGGIRIYLQPNYLTGPPRLYEASSSGFSSMKSDRSQLKSLPSIDDHYYGVGYQSRGVGSYQSQGRENLIGRSDDRDLQPQSYKWFEHQQDSIHFNEDDHSSDSVSIINFFCFYFLQLATQHSFFNFFKKLLKVIIHFSQDPLECRPT